jgi:quinol monooxygenase YgiN
MSGARVLISGEIDVAPEVRERTLQEAQPLIAAALAEAGCVHYAWTADLCRPGRIHVFEEWDTAEDLAAHLVGQPYFRMAAHLAAAGIRSAVTRKYRTDLVEPVYGPDGVATAEFLTALPEGRR